MKTLSVVPLNTFNFPADSVENVYAAREVNHITQEVSNIVCYRTVNGATHSAVVNSDGTFTNRASAEKMKK